MSDDKLINTKLKGKQNKDNVKKEKIFKIGI